MRKAIENYNMIEDGDKIAVGLSGGKDSITLLMGLKALQRFYPKKFEVIAISVNPGFEFFNSDFFGSTASFLRRYWKVKRLFQAVDSLYIYWK